MWVYRLMGGLLLFVVITGCGIPSGEISHRDTALLNVYQPRIVRGKTTTEELQQWFGPPSLITEDGQGRKNYVYLFQGGDIRLDILMQDGAVYRHEVTQPGSHKGF